MGSNNSPKNLALKRLDLFVGALKTEGEIKATEITPAIPIGGTDRYGWLPGGYFLIHWVDVHMGDKLVNSIEVIGYDPSTREYPMHYFGYQGNTGVMHASVEGDIWKFKGETEHFTGSFNKAGDIMSGKWERLDGTDWIHWMDITLTKTRNGI